MNPNTKRTTKEAPSCLVVKTGATCCPTQGTLLTVFFLLVCISQVGCNLYQNARRTIFQEPSEYSWIYDRKESIKVYRTWADRAWQEQCKGDSPSSYSKVYALGFKDGFVDMVFAGGSGEPPALPPREYWNVDLRNPNGHTEATDWFAGYRHGAQLAREEGYRERALVPSSLSLFGQRDKCSKRPNCQCPSCLAESLDSFAPDSPVPDDAMEEQPIPRLVSPRQPEPAAETTSPELELPTQQEALPSPRRTTQPTLPGPTRPSRAPPAKLEVPMPEISPDVDAIFDSSASIPIPSSRRPAQRLNFVAAAQVRQASAEISLSDQSAKKRFQQHSR